ncbi:uncharacterized protein LOC129568045 [Sitodiplosis mosellana]|uniref:uncharacterized protein LOC129568045 n=1 Tax=Sitodiplosis mosellana TaxID=263140 RepID=UPI0024442045|nr:uncharacterized protein LOC129568045 [Sitodiplosis mosellana]
MLGDIDEPTLPFGLSDVGLDRADVNEKHLMLPQKINDHLRTYARKLQVSLSSLCHLAWAQVLARASGREAVVFGTVLVGRLQAGEENNNIMGPMINTLPLRVDINNTDIETAVRHTHARLSALLAHEYAPLVMAQRSSGVPTSLPLFSALLNYCHNQKAKQITTYLPEVTFLGGAERTNYPLVLSVEDNGDSLGLTPQVVSPHSAARIGAYMQEALVSLADVLTHKPHQPVRILTIMPTEERTLLLDTWNQTTVDYPSDRCFHQLFEVQVERDGEAIAVECEGKILSYMELNAQANRLAHYLIAQGVKPDDRVALCVPRSNTMIVAMLGILKAGGAYVPLDPAYPSQRLTNILRDADPIFWLVDATGQKVLGVHQVPVIDLDKPFPDNLSIDNPDVTKLGVTSTNLAYVIYTSGSTGTPKGVMVEHQPAVQLFKGITVLSLTPSTLKMLMLAKNVTLRYDQLRFVMFGGEASDPLIVREWNEKFDKNQTKLFHVYGPTETIVFATGWICDTTISASSSLPIGRPLPNKRMYLLDADGEPVPLGAEGELYIGGTGVARGYLNRPELTAERFLLDPFSEDPAARMYRTGDRVRYLPDGNLVFLGRTDQQMKIRGFRIEPGEIETHLVEHPKVQEAVIQSYGNDSNARLIAYVVANADVSLAQDLRNYMSELVPEYMVPAAYVCLSSLPLTINGKVDRRALPAPDEDAFAREKYASPLSEMEEKLAKIWRELLGIDRISRHDNFFALGGHSLLVVRLLLELRRIGLDITVREVFDAPTLAALASSLARYQAMHIPLNLITTDSTAITPDMLPLITLSQADIESIIAQIPGGVANIQDIYGLAPLQHGLLFHHIQSERGDPYLLVFRMQFTDWTSLERYADAMQQVVARHDILRTVFIWEGLSEPAQVVMRHVPSILSEVSLNYSGKAVLEQLSHRFDPRHYRLNLTKAPLLRLMAAPTSDESWVALQMIHHLIIDHSTLESLQTEVNAIMIGKIGMLTSPTSFRHFVAHAQLGFSPTEHTRFFTEMLGDIDEPTLPFGLSDVGLDGTEINEANLMLPQTLNDHLRVHARKLQVSLASVCHLAWAQVLARASDRETVVFGTVLLGRLQGGEENNNIIGPMINTLPIRIDNDERSVENAVRHTHARLSELLAHEYAPLVLAQRCSGCPVGLPLFSAMLNYRHNQTRSQVTASFPGVTFFDGEERTNYPLGLSVEDDGNSLGLTTQVISPMSAALICAYMQQALESIVNTLSNKPQLPVRTLTVMPSKERTLLLHTWNQTTFTYSPACCLHQLFEAHVERDEHAIAVECNGDELSYTELNAQANRLAHHLIAQGVNPDDRIALCVDRNITMLIAMLGILKAGGAYVPLDPAYSCQRLTDILNDAKPILLLADATGRKALGDHQVPGVDLDKSLPDDLRFENPDTIKLGLTPTHLAYVIYTSGSTGTPKGVMVEHQQIVRLFEVTREKFDFNKDDKWCLFHSFSFDVSVWEMWGALSNGSQLSIVSARSTDEFHDWICTSGITVLNQTPSAFKSLMWAKNTIPSFDRLRYLIFAGEVFDPLIAKEWWEKYDKNGTVLVNMYGITEITVHATYQRIEALKNAYSIGRPLADLCVYLLDSYGEPVPLGAEGEMYIGGGGVARGYLNRPELTAERFLSDPFSDNPAARMYRTGDRARYLSNGNLVYLGRTDQQVKIRGFRIELGEIEAHLVEHPQVHESIVQFDGNGSDARLVAYVVADVDTSLSQNLRNYLSTLLPDYMVPSAYVCLPSMPLTPNGKLDRRALPPPDDEAFARQQYEAPQGVMEETLADIWRELLIIERISRHDNFFALGGHSLLVVRLLARLRQIGLDSTVREVFDAPTLAILASTLICYKVVAIPPNLITTDSTEITPEMLPLITLSQTEIDAIIEQVPGGVANIQDIYGLASLQHGMLFHHIMAEEDDPYLLINRLSFIDRTTLKLYADALQQVIKRHDILRTVIIWEGLSEPVQVVLRQVPSLLTEITLDGAGEPVLEQLSHQFYLRCYRLDLTKAPLLRLFAVPTSEGNWVAFQLTHHSIIDHSTLERMEAEVHVIMNGKIEELLTPTPFRHFVAQTRLGASQDEHKRFFTKMLGDIDEPTLPFGLSGVGLDGTAINEAHLMLPQTLNNQVREFARKLRVSLSSLCHLAWAQVLAQTSGREAVVFGTVLLGRLQAGERNDRTMGMMINTLPLRLDIDETSVGIAVRHTHTRLSALLAHEHAPLVLAQRCSGVPAGLPLFSALLNYRHNQRTEHNTSYPGVSLLGGATPAAYPLTMSFDDNDEELCLSVHVLSPVSAIRICAYMQQALESLTDALTHKP